MTTPTGDPPCWMHLQPDDARSGAVVQDLGLVATTGPSGAVWSLPHGSDLDGNLVRLQGGDAIDEHVNGEVDVVLFVQSGRGTLTVDGVVHPLRPLTLALLPRDASRRIAAAAPGLTFLSIHARRGPLTLSPKDRGDH